MSSIFYDRLVDWPAAEAELKRLTNTEEEFHQLSQVLDQTTHHELFAIIFRVLPERAHRTFIQKVQKAPHAETHLQTLRLYEPKIEEILREAALSAHRKFFDAIHD